MCYVHHSKLKKKGGFYITAESEPRAMLSELYIFYVGRCDSGWVIQQKTATSAIFTDQHVFMEMSTNMRRRSTVLCLVKVTVLHVSDKCFCGSSLNVATRGICCLLVCLMWGTSFLLTVIIFSTGWISAQQEWGLCSRICIWSVDLH